MICGITVHDSITPSVLAKDADYDSSGKRKGVRRHGKTSQGIASDSLTRRTLSSRAVPAFECGLMLESGECEVSAHIIIDLVPRERKDTWIYDIDTCEIAQAWAKRKGV